MLEELKFNRGFKEGSNLFAELTDNTIIICQSWELMYSVANEIFNTVNGEAEYNDYFCDDGDVGKANFFLQFRLNSALRINKQQITLALEPAIIYKAKNIKDVWFCEQTEEGKTIYALTEFKGCNEFWDKGLDEMYKMVAGNRFGGYDGEWLSGAED